MRNKNTITFTLLLLLIFLNACSDKKKKNISEEVKIVPKTEQMEKIEVIKLGDNNWQTYTDIIIDAPTEKVWKTLTNFEEMTKWSSSFKGIKGNLKNGSKIVVNYAVNGKINKIPHTLIYKEGEEFGWSDPMGGPFLGFTDNHRYRLEKISDSKTRFIQKDNFKGKGNSNLTSEDIANRTAKVYPKFNRELKQESEKNIKNLNLTENKLGDLILKKGMPLVELKLNKIFDNQIVSKNIGEQDGQNYFYYNIGKEAILETPDTKNESLSQIRINDKSNISDEYGIKLGSTYNDIKEKRPNMNISTEHYHIYLSKEGSNIEYEMSLENYNGPDKEEYTIDDIKDSKVTSIIWK